MLNPVHLDTLQVVLQRGSFVAAADVLGYTASAVSQQMSMLERATGLALFERLPRSIQPTAAARELARESVDLVAGLRSLELDAKARAAGETGQLQIGSFSSAGMRLLPSALANLLRTRGGVAVELEYGEPADLLPLLRDGRLDVALVYENEIEQRRWPANLVTVPLLTERRYVVLPPGHPHRDRNPVKLTDLRDDPWVTSLESPGLAQLCASVGFQPRVIVRSDEYSVVGALVRAGVGVTLLPELALPPYPELTAQLLTPEPPPRYVHALYRRTNNNPLVRPLLTALAEAAAQF
ncbi:LysR family transcriptional regulator [Fodinicola feengrottensis]|uniref:LysR family transcriptional regulator n=1 Tax=Fodinicola feengrottensis TaxID=435914 RepID=A0ABN2HRQ2_9ACTN